METAPGIVLTWLMTKWLTVPENPYRLVLMTIRAVYALIARSVRNLGIGQITAASMGRSVLIVERLDIW